MNKYKKLLENFVDKEVSKIMEYNFDNFENKYQNVDSERLNKNLDYLKSRQTRDGMKFKYTSQNTTYKGIFYIYLIYIISFFI